MGKLCMNPLIITVPPLAPPWTGNQLNVVGPTVIHGVGCGGSV